ncbi:MAG: hypothetical protein LBM64_09530 [Deltaproteobacteria bacterium]|nr:hypothetical protein [Deltaproteobacteria bacterium]
MQGTKTKQTGPFGFPPPFVNLQISNLVGVVQPSAPERRSTAPPGGRQNQSRYPVPGSVLAPAPPEDQTFRLVRGGGQGKSGQDSSMMRGELIQFESRMVKRFLDFFDFFFAAFGQCLKTLLECRR